LIGEAEAVVLALELNADPLPVDECDAGGLAKKLGLQVMGTLGVLALAKYSEDNSEVKADNRRAHKSGFWISREILKELL